MTTAAHWFDEIARKRFTYKADPLAFDNWRSHRQAVEQDEAWSGDCDDLASTVLDMLAEDGYPLDMLYRLFVSSTGSRKHVDHMVGCAMNVDGRFYIVGDTFGPTYPVDEMKHVGVWFQRMDEVRDEIVRRGVPWKQSK